MKRVLCVLCGCVSLLCGCQSSPEIGRDEWVKVSERPGESIEAVRDREGGGIDTVRIHGHADSNILLVVEATPGATIDLPEWVVFNRADPGGALETRYYAVQPGHTVRDALLWLRQRFSFQPK